MISVLWNKMREKLLRLFENTHCTNDAPEIIHEATREAQSNERNDERADEECDVSDHDDFNDGHGHLSLYKDEDLWISISNVDTTNKRYYRNGSDIDGGEHQSVFEYNFTGNNVLQRLIEQWDKELGSTETEYDVKDNVVLEEDIRKRSTSDIAKIFLDSELENAHKAVKWHVVADYRVKYFLKYQHPDLFPTVFFQQEYERICSGKKKLSEQIWDAAKLCFGTVPKDDAIWERFQAILEEGGGGRKVGVYLIPESVEEGSPRVILAEMDKDGRLFELKGDKLNDIFDKWNMEKAGIDAAEFLDNDILRIIKRYC